MSSNEGKGEIARVFRGSFDIRGFEDIEFNFQLLRSLGVVSYGGGTVGEILSIVPAIRPEEPETWVAQFKELAIRSKKLGLDLMQKGRMKSAHEAFLRASSYFRAAEYYGDPRDSKTRYIGMESRDCFIYAFRTANLEFEAVRIPYGDDFIPAYWISPLPQSSQTKKRVIMMMSGFDGTSEEMYFQSGAAALNRGYAVLLFDGPGQVGMRRFSTETPFRPDFEVAVAKVVDYLLSRGDVDPSKIALYGISLGGYFSLRAAAHEPRIKALISNSPITDIYKYMIGVAGEEAINSPQDIGLDYIDEIPEEYLGKGKKLQILNIILRYGERSMFAAFERMKEFTVGEAIKNIRSPFLGMVSQGEGLGAMGQAEEAVKGVSGPSSLRVFTKDEGADSHCQLTNLPLSNAVLLDWLDEVFGVRS